MRPQQPAPERRVDRDGVTHVAPSRSSSGVGLWLVGGALVFTILCGALSAWWLSSDVEVEPMAELPPAPVVAPPPMVAQAPAPRPRPVAPAPQPVAAPVVEEPMPPPSDPEPPYTGPTGTQLYRPGTKPLKRGIVVPEDFELPPGYVRHYQSTDNGERVQAILMFHPDYAPSDASGQPIALPENRVVPAEMAPPGLPIEMLQLPEGAESGAGEP
ncbi:hypothetical protein HPC49_28185 [Pyxidicoccus fallax]|uniref:Uncharacterized protein n=1 Tax=Pyxidicoccus fallax TaxID=394095 RepID=A0A848LST8_9BACT|nr:hypothetical protein [Pyxidicoccus fallax]NMO21005.1 hypothetical protein [Pyxidicoccus fallax]NPC82084.1 hypothetical protein [Pyxidicoccus fallax]